MLRSVNAGGHRFVRALVVLTGICLVGWTGMTAGEPQSDSRLLVIDPEYSIEEGPVRPATSDLERTTPPPRPPAKPGADDTLDRVSVLVYFDPELSRLSLERSNTKALATELGGFTRYEYKAVMKNVVNLRNVPRAAVARLEQMPGVAKVELDQYHPNLVRLDESTPLVRGLQTQLTAAGLPYDGTGVRLCVADTGIDMDHIMYSTRIDTAASYDFVNNDGNPDDDQGHGSHVAGIAVGGTGLTVDFGCEGSEPFQGMAPNATLIGSKILNSFGGGSDSDIIAGIDHCADQSPSGGRADVINLSIGTGNYSSGSCTHSWAVASNNAVANGVVVVAASGNENNSNSMGSPACGVDVIAVGATYKDDYPNCEDGTSNFNWGDCIDNSPNRDDIVCFSNESDHLDVAAPGSVIQSASNAAGGSSVAGQSGTSMASPMVAGLAALILDADPSLTPAQVRQIIRDGAIDMGPTGFDRAYGHGRIDAINSLNLITPCSVDADCDDGLYCNGAETCNAGSCEVGSDPCGGGICDEATDSCSTLAYEWNMNSNPGWTMSGQWAWGQPTGGGGQHGTSDPTSGATGSNVLGYNLSGDYANNLAETHLTSTAINMSGLTNATLRFQRWLGVEQPAYDHAYVRVSNNGSSWTTLWENSAEVSDGGWTQQEFDISSVADNQSTVYLRWTMGTTDSSWQYAGWNIDDVEIHASGGGPSCTDGIQNQGEDRIDCGGPCAACDCTGDGACDDGAFCNGSETCDAFGSCQAGTTVDCDDGLYCNGAETCDNVAGCQSGTPVSCDDGVGCTSDSCNEGSDSCDNTTNDAVCDDGAFCNGAETCHATLDCQAGSDPCPGGDCDEGTDQCVDCTIDADCNDGQYCNGVETCNAGTCQAGTAPNCSDGVGCTIDSCNEGSDSCDNTPSDGLCDDGAYCNGAETCDAFADCQSGTSVDCDDGVGCTIDSCNEGSDSCDNTTNDAACDDGAFCNGAETCSATLDCQGGSDPCGGAACDEGSDTCDGGDEELWMSFRSNTAVPGVGTVRDEDIVIYNVNTGLWSRIFDGSDVGLGALEIDGFALLASGDLLLSFTAAGTVGGLSVDDSDIVQFTPGSLGDFTTGTFAWYFDGSDVGLTTNGEDVDSIALDGSGNLVISTSGGVNASGASGADEDLWIFNATSLGATTAGSFTRLFDGSDVGLNTSGGEDVDAATLTAGGDLLFSTVGNFSVSGLSGTDEDVGRFNATTWGNSTSGSFASYLDLSALGIAAGEDIGSMHHKQ
ncbi:MAG: S8 family serine peptidase [bacterium]|nr:S8 family serine peptidase [bacterium]